MAECWDYTEISSFTCLVTSLSDSTAWTVTRVLTHGLFMWLGSLTVWQLDPRGSI